MSESEWNQFFDWLRWIVQRPGKSADEKKAMILGEAKKRGAEYDVNEFAEWFEADAEPTKDFNE